MTSHYEKHQNEKDITMSENLKHALVRTGDTLYISREVIIMSWVDRWRNVLGTFWLPIKVTNTTKTMFDAKIPGRSDTIRFRKSDGVEHSSGTSRIVAYRAGEEVHIPPFKEKSNVEDQQTEYRNALELASLISNVQSSVSDHIARDVDWMNVSERDCKTILAAFKCLPMKE